MQVFSGQKLLILGYQWALYTGTHVLSEVGLVGFVDQICCNKIDVSAAVVKLLLLIYTTNALWMNKLFQSPYAFEFE